MAREGKAPSPTLGCTRNSGKKLLPGKRLPQTGLPLSGCSYFPPESRPLWKSGAAESRISKVIFLPWPVGLDQGSTLLLLRFISPLNTGHTGTAPLRGLFLFVFKDKRRAYTEISEQKYSEKIALSSSGSLKPSPFYPQRVEGVLTPGHRAGSWESHGGRKIVSR